MTKIENFSWNTKIKEAKQIIFYDNSCSFNHARPSNQGWGKKCEKLNHVDKKLSIFDEEISENLWAVIQKLNENKNNREGNKYLIFN